MPQIRASVEKLGFKFTDIKILLGSHAHGDHMEGDALVKELTAAQVMVMDQDIPAISRLTPHGKPHPIDCSHGPQSVRRQVPERFHWGNFGLPLCMPS